jgi:hypothetical protein
MINFPFLRSQAIDVLKQGWFRTEALTSPWCDLLEVLWLQFDNTLATKAHLDFIEMQTSAVNLCGLGWDLYRLVSKVDAQFSLSLFSLEKKSLFRWSVILLVGSITAKGVARFIHACIFAKREDNQQRNLRYLYAARTAVDLAGAAVLTGGDLRILVTLPMRAYRLRLYGKRLGGIIPQPNSPNQPPLSPFIQIATILAAAAETIFLSIPFYYPQLTSQTSALLEIKKSLHVWWFFVEELECQALWKKKGGWTVFSLVGDLILWNCAQKYVYRTEPKHTVFELGRFIGRDLSLLACNNSSLSRFSAAVRAALRMIAIRNLLAMNGR